MKYVSRSPGLRVVLTPGLPGNTVLGTPPTAGHHVLFSSGFVTIPDTDTETIRLLEQSHKGFGRDFVRVETEKPFHDPYKHSKRSLEPEHDILTRDGLNLNPRPEKVDIATQVRTMAEKMLTEMLPVITAKVRADILKESATAAPAPVAENTLAPASEPTTAAVETVIVPPVVAPVTKAKTTKKTETKALELTPTA